MLGVHQEDRLATRLNSVREASRFFRFPTFARLFFRHRSVRQFLVSDRINCDKVSWLVSVFVGEFEAGSLARWQVDIFLGRRDSRCDFFRLEYLQLSAAVVVRQLCFDELYIANVSFLFNR